MAQKKQAAVAVQAASGGWPFTFTTARFPIYGDLR